MVSDSRKVLSGGMTSDIRKVHDVQKANCPDIGAVPHPDMPGGLLAPFVPIVSEH